MSNLDLQFDMLSADRDLQFSPGWQNYQTDKVLDAVIL